SVGAGFGVSRGLRASNGAAADLGDLRDLGQRYTWLGPQRGERPIARLGGRMKFVFPLRPRAASPLRSQPSSRALLRALGRLRSEQRREHGAENRGGDVAVELETNDVRDDFSKGRTHGTKSPAAGARTINPRTAVCEDRSTSTLP